jgi:hypothetical protein
MAAFGDGSGCMLGDGFEIDPDGGLLTVVHDAAVEANEGTFELLDLATLPFVCVRDRSGEK